MSPSDPGRLYRHPIRKEGLAPSFESRGLTRRGAGGGSDAFPPLAENGDTRCGGEGAASKELRKRLPKCTPLQEDPDAKTRPLFSHDGHPHPPPQAFTAP